MGLQIIRRGKYRIESSELTFALLWITSMGIVFGWFLGYAVAAALMLCLLFIIGYVWQKKLRKKELEDNEPNGI